MVRRLKAVGSVPRPPGYRKQSRTMTRIASPFAMLGMIAACISTACASAPGELRTWTDATGKFQTVARFIDLTDGRVRLEKADGGTVSIPVERLSEKDLHYAKSQVPPITDAASPMPASRSNRAPQLEQREPAPPDPAATDVTRATDPLSKDSAPARKATGSPQPDPTRTDSKSGEFLTELLNHLRRWGIIEFPLACACLLLF